MRNRESLKQEKGVKMKRSARKAGLRIIFLLAFLIPGVLKALSAFPPDWKSVGIRPGKNGIFLKNGGWMRVHPEGNAELLKVSVKDDALVVDTRDFYRKCPGGSVIFQLEPVEPKRYQPGKEYFFSAEVRSEPAAAASLFFEGRDRNDRHYWRVQQIFCGERFQIFRFQQTLPETPLKRLHLRLDFRKPAVYFLRKCAFGKVVPLKNNPRKQWVVNGGAERGFYGTAYYDMRFLGRAGDGKHVDYRGKAFTGTMKVEIDSKEFHSGTRSFKITSPENSINQLYFNAVPTVPGRPATLSVWMKAEKPTVVAMNLFPKNAVTYRKNVTVGREWKRYVLSIPSWGMRSLPGITVIGSDFSSFGYNLVYPRFDFRPGSTVYLDDLSYHQDTDSVFREESSVWIAGALEKKEKLYFSDETIAADLSFRPARPSAKQMRRSWKLLDFFGKEVASGRPETVALPHRETLRIVPPKNVRGALTLIVEAESDGKKQNHVLPVGVVDPPGPLNPRFGINIDATDRFNADRVIALLKPFRIGSVRLWNFRDPVRFHKAGFFTLLNVGSFNPNPKEQFFLPRDYSLWKELLKKKIETVKGAVDVYELLNEPNIWSGRSPNPDPSRLTEANAETVAECAKALAPVIRRADPGAKIAGPTPCKTVVSWIETVLGKGAADCYDILSEHPYRQLPELPDYGEDLRSLSKAVARFGKPYAFYGTEAGRAYPSHSPNNLLPERARLFVARDIRNHLIGFANGLEKYFHYSAGGGIIAGTNWHVILAGNGDSDCAPHPGPLLFAVRAAADRLESAVPAGQVRIGVDCRCFIFDRSDRRIAVLWKWNGKPDPIHFSRKFRAYDMMGSRVDGDRFLLSEYPVYLESELPVRELAKVIGSARRSVSGEVVRTAVKVTGQNSAEITIRNLTGSPISGSVRFAVKGVVSDAEFHDIPAEQTKTLPFRGVGPFGTAAVPGTIEVSVPRLNLLRKEKVRLRAVLVPWSGKRPRIDGDLSDWPAVTPIRLDASGAVREQAVWTPEEEKTTVLFRSFWNESRLYLSFEVRKKSFYPEDRYGEASIWKGDSVQIAFDTVCNAARTQAGYQDDDFEYSFALFKKQPLVICAYASASTYDSLPKAIGVNRQVEFALRRTPDGVVYEIALPPVSISPFKLTAGAMTRFNFLVNLNNGKQRIGWLELQPGIGRIPKRPGLFPDFVLLPEKTETGEGK